MNINYKTDTQQINKRKKIMKKNRWKKIKRKLTKKKTEFTENEKIVLLEVAEKVFFNLQWDSQFSRWVEDSDDFMVEFDNYDYKLLNKIIEKLKGR